MIKINDKTLCCGCTSCYSICPEHCISMHADEEGFLYPLVDESCCIHCGQCEDVCPMIHSSSDALKRMDSEYECEGRLIRHKDVDSLNRSAAGGFFSALSTYLLDQGYQIYGAVYDDDFRVIHCETASADEIWRFSGSKYVQSDLGNSYKNIKTTLDEGGKVCFSGTYCQVAGLKSYLGKTYPELITVDLVCAGVLSPLLWEKYRDSQENAFNSKLTSVNFRNKTYGYHSTTMKLVFQNGSVYSRSGRIDPAMNFFVRGIAKRPACYQCPFKGKSRISDFTLFDSWHAGSLLGKKDDNKGYTTVIVQNPKALKIIEELGTQYLDVHTIDIDRAISLDGIMVEQLPVRPVERDTFYHTLNTEGLNGCKKQYLNLQGKDYLWEWSKPILHKLGLMNHLKSLKKG